MGNATSFLQIGGVALALGWPLAAGLGVVVWSKTRAARKRRRQATLDETVGLIRAAEAAPALRLDPDSLQEPESAYLGRPVSPPASPKAPLTTA